jgi:hypothetical protein
VLKLIKRRDSFTFNISDCHKTTVVFETAVQIFSVAVQECSKLISIAADVWQNCTVVTR